jgi:hypothetical protein
LNLSDIFYTYANAVIPIGWVYHGTANQTRIPRNMLLEARHEGLPINVFPCATAFLLSIDYHRTRFVTANHAFPDLQRDNAEVCVIVPDFMKCPFEVTQDDLKAYLGVIDFVRLEDQDICVFDVDTPEALHNQHPTPLTLGADKRVGDEVCTIGYPFIGYEGTFTEGMRDVRFVERLTYAHLSAIWPDRGALTLEFDNYVGPGNSGGPLINIRTGATIGIVTWSRLEEQHTTTFSHAGCVEELEWARVKFPDLPQIKA